MLTSAAARLRTAKALMRGSGMRSASPPMSKFWTELCVESQSQHTLLFHGRLSEGGPGFEGCPTGSRVPRLGVTAPALAALMGVSGRKNPIENHKTSKHSPLSLRAIVAVCGDLQLAERVALDAELVLPRCDGRRERHGEAVGRGKESDR